MIYDTSLWDDTDQQRSVWCSLTGAATGVPDHVAIVEKCENGIVYTVEGNTSTRVNGESVRGVWQHQYPVSDQSILGYGTI